MPMQRQSHPRRIHQPEALQFDLFHPRTPEPEWGQLPAAARQTLTSLMARLIAGHGRDECCLPPAAAAGGRRDD